MNLVESISTFINPLIYIKLNLSLHKVEPIYIFNHLIKDALILIKLDDI